MKKIFVSIAVVALLSACGGSEEKKTETKTGEVATEEKDITTDPAYSKGLALIAKSDCLTCHKVDEPLTGPTYRDVANKYGGLPDTVVSYLAGKIIKGGNGVWGEAFMTPHPGVSQEDAEAMVRYILLLKNK